jgi:hypothetical protein
MPALRRTVHGVFVTWTKLGDEFPAAARELTDAEFRTHAEALCWSSMRLLDLRIPKADVRRFAESPDAELAVKGLAAKGWWADCGDTWDIGMHFPEWQQDRAQVEHRRAYLAEAQRRSKRHRAGDHSLCLPGKCPLAPPSTVDSTSTPSVVSTVDSTGTSTRDPGRVGSGATHPPDPEKQDQGQVQEPSAAKSQNRRLHNGPETVAGDERKISLHDAESTTAGTGTRATFPNPSAA